MNDRLPHRPHVVGVRFDAVRTEGLRGKPVADRPTKTAAEDAGPIVCEAARDRWVYFLLPPGTVRRYDWPPGVQQLAGRGDRTVTYIGIPALDGNTWPLRWYSEPTPTAPRVDAMALHMVVARPHRWLRAAQVPVDAEPMSPPAAMEPLPEAVTPPLGGAGDGEGRGDGADGGV
ncbi:hypothetical protein [Streptomyces sp. PU_AKi4]|uniref:hypothetical protein n=1 Tax=Streptomyces sp. PU_AKi4 TaxID=2800809 RepID=UPI0035240B16